MPAHLDHITVFIGIMFVFSLWISWRSWQQANRLLAGSSPLLSWPGWLTIGGIAASAVLVTAISLVRTGSEYLPADWSRSIARADDRRIISKFQNSLDWISREYISASNMLEASIVEQPEGWKESDEAERYFRAEWAKREGIAYKNPFDAVGDRKPEPEFQDAWQKLRGGYLAALKRPALDHSNLRSANLELAFLAGMKLRHALLEQANLYRAQLERADLTQALLNRANLSESRLESSTLILAHLTGANLSGTRLNGANLSGARLFGDNAQTPMDLNSAVLTGSMWRRSALRYVDMNTVDIVQLNQFSSTFGDASVKLPTDYPRPCQWAAEVLSDNQYFARWREWLEKNDVSQKAISENYGLAGYTSANELGDCAAAP